MLGLPGFATCALVNSSPYSSCTEQPRTPQHRSQHLSLRFWCVCVCVLALLAETTLVE